MWSFNNFTYSFLKRVVRTNRDFKVFISIIVSGNHQLRGVLDTTLCDKVCQWLAASQWFFLGTPASTTNKTDYHDITEILLKVALNTLTLYLITTNNKQIHNHSLEWRLQCCICNRTTWYDLLWAWFNLVIWRMLNSICFW